MKEGKLVISLDFELLWGIFDKVDYNQKFKYFENTRKVIPKILKIFEANKIKCTWATVGMVFNKDWDEWEENFPSELPDYQNSQLSAYTYGRSIKSTKTERICFAPGLIERIRDAKDQEVGTHTYSHYYALEPGQDINSFKADVERTITVARNFGIKLDSLVFPRNQFNDSYLKVCQELQISKIRSNPTSWYWKNPQENKLIDKIFRSGDAYIGLNNKSYSFDEREKNGLSLQRSSRFLRPYSSNSILNNLKIKRIVSEMTTAAKKGETYHLWWHPHNFGENPDRSLNDLHNLLDHFDKLRNKYGFQSRSMRNVTSNNF